MTDFRKDPIKSLKFKKKKCKLELLCFNTANWLTGVLVAKIQKKWMNRDVKSTIGILRVKQMKKSVAGLQCTNIGIINWRNFADIDINLPLRVFLAGPNASGKSNFLDAFRFLRDLVVVGGGLQEAVKKRGGVSSLRCLSSRQYSDITLRIKLGSEDGEPATWQYELSFNQDNLRRPIIKREIVWRQGEIIRARPDEADNQDKERLTQTHLEQVNSNQDFREIADFLSSIRYLHIVPQLIREPDRLVGKVNDPFGSDFLETIAQTPEKTRKARLQRINNALILAVPQLHGLELIRDKKRGAPHLRGKYDHWRAQGAWQTEEHFSDGTLRLIGLLWALQEGSGPLLLEEPELSLHPEVVRFIPQMFARVQRRTNRAIIVSTHSSDIFLDEGVGLDEVLLLIPGSEGTTIRAASDFPEIKTLLEAGYPLSNAVIAHTKPAKSYQLSMFEVLKQ